jgi:hypothetical protein
LSFGKSWNYRLRGLLEAEVWNVSGMYNITVRQSVIKKCANEVQMLKE